MQRKVLIVEDDPLFADDTKTALELSSAVPYNVLIAASGSQALAQYRANKDTSLVILDTDLNPTNEKGWNVYDQLKTEGYTGLALARSARGLQPEWIDRNIPFLDKSASDTELENTIDRLYQR